MCQSSNAEFSTGRWHLVPSLIFERSHWLIVEVGFRSFPLSSCPPSGKDWKRAVESVKMIQATCINSYGCSYLCLHSYVKKCLMGELILEYSTAGVSINNRTIRGWPSRSKTNVISKAEHNRFLSHVLVDAMVLGGTFQVLPLNQTFNSLLDKLWGRGKSDAQLTHDLGNQIIVMECFSCFHYSN